MKKTMMAAFCVLLLFLQSSCAKKEEPKVEKPQPVTGVRFEAAKSSAVEEIYEAVGTVRSQTASAISARIMGNILALHVREGDPVKKGQLLVEIDDRDFAARLRRAQAGMREAEDLLQEAERNIQAGEAAKNAAEANQNLAEATFHRYQTLFERKSVSPQEFDEVKARYQAGSAEVARAKEMIQSLLARKDQMGARIEQARAEVTRAQLSGGYARILSPMNGVVVSKPAEVGIMAAPGLPLLTIEDNTRYRLEAMVMESHLGKVRVGQTIRVVIDALDKAVVSGKVAEIAPAADPASRTAAVKIDLFLASQKGERKPILRSGLFGKALFPVGQRTILTIPTKATVQRGQILGVYVVDPGSVARLRLIQIGKAYGEQVEVLAGLREGEKIIVEGMEKVKEGNQIKE